MESFIKELETSPTVDTEDPGEICIKELERSITIRQRGYRDKLHKRIRMIADYDEPPGSREKLHKRLRTLPDYDKKGCRVKLHKSIGTFPDYKKEDTEKRPRKDSERSPT